jgi:hypothetical protein
MTTVSKRLLSPQLHRQQLIERQEVVALLFNVSDIAITLTSIERFLKEDEDDGEEEADQS